MKRMPHKLPRRKAARNRISQLNFAASPWHSRLMRWLAYGLVRALVGIAGYAQKHGDPRNFTQATEE